MLPATVQRADSGSFSLLLTEQAFAVGSFSKQTLLELWFHLRFSVDVLSVRPSNMGTTVTPNETLKPLPAATFDKIRSYTELRMLIRVSLRVENPEWVEPNGDSPICDSYEARFAELLGL
jgi:hypothetical protein